MDGILVPIATAAITPVRPSTTYVHSRWMGDTYSAYRPAVAAAWSSRARIRATLRSAAWTKNLRCGLGGLPWARATPPFRNHDASGPALSPSGRRPCPRLFGGAAGAAGSGPGRYRHRSQRQRAGVSRAVRDRVRGELVPRV